MRTKPHPQVGLCKFPQSFLAAFLAAKPAFPRALTYTACCLALPFLLFSSGKLQAQATPDVAQGMKLYGSYHGGAIDNVSLTNGNLFVHADLMDYSQRGGELSYPLVLDYNGKSFTAFVENCPQPPGSHQPCPEQIVLGPPWNHTEASSGNGVTIGFQGLPFQASAAAASGINTGLTFNGTPIYKQTYSAVTPDGSLHQLVATDSGMAALDGGEFFASSPGSSLVDQNATSFSFAGSGAEDRNGNLLTAAEDTLARQLPPAPAPTAAGNPSTASLSSCPLLTDYPNQPVTYAYTWTLPAPASSGGSLTLILCYSSVYVHTNFFGGATTGNFRDLAKTFSMLQSVVFPDNTYWGFEYDAADPNDSTSIHFGDLLKIVLPTGGSITYTWGTALPCSSPHTNGGGGESRAVLTRTVDAHDGSPAQTWHYQANGGIVTDPLGNDTVHTITQLGATCSLYETQTDFYQGSRTGGTLLKTIKTDYQYTSNPWDGQLVAGITEADSVANVFPKTITTILPNGQQSRVEMAYDTGLVYHGPLDGLTWNEQTCEQDPSGQTLCSYTASTTNPVTTYHGSYGKLTDKKEYEWGQGAPGPLLRETTTTYEWQVDSRYLTANLLDLPASVQIYDGAGHLCARTDYAYDEATDPQGHSLFIATSGLPQHTTAPGAVRGNLTTVTRWLSVTPCQAGATWNQIASHTAYFDTGEVASSYDPLGHTTTHSYDAADAGTYPTQTCSPQTGAVAHCVSGAYDFNTGLLTSFTDENSQVSTFSYDNRWRMTVAKYPIADSSNINPETDFFYPDPLTVTRKKKLDSLGAVIQDDASFDGLGRTKQTTLHDPAGNDLVDTTYDALGRVSTVSNPHRSTASSTDGITTTYYDALGRVVQVAPQDGTLLPAGTSPTSCQPNNICTDYSSFPTVTVTDQAGKLRRTRTDALGRLVEVDEPGPGANTAGSPAWAGISVSGSLHSNTTPATAASWSVTISGSEKTITKQSCHFLNGVENCVPVTTSDVGTVTVTVNGYSAVYNYPQSGETLNSIASALAGSLNSGAPVKATPNGNIINVVSKTIGAAGNYSLSATSYSQTGNASPSGSYQAAAAVVTQGADATTTYDSGTLSVTVDGFTASASYNQNLNNTSSAMASALATALNVPSSPVTAQPTGSGITITAKVVGSSGEYSVTGGSTASFTASSATLGNDTNSGGLFTPYQTFYTYDALGNLLQANQLGDGSQPARVRTFTYDSLSRLLSATNPETGKITYTYDNDGNLLTKTAPAPNQTGTATVTTTFRYDALHRLIYESFSDGTYRGGFTYDEVGTTQFGNAVANGIGRLTSSWEAWGGQGFSYDALGRTTLVRRVVEHPADFLYTYNLDGSIKSLQYPSGRVVNYAYDTAGHTLSAADSNGASYVSGASYAPTGAVTAYLSGASAGFNGINQTFLYNPRLQLCRITAWTTGSAPTSCNDAANHGNLIDRSYNFGFATANNGNVLGITDNRDNSRSQSFAYDNLNRLISAQNAGTDCSKLLPDGKTEYWGNSYGYDPWGNLINKTITKCGAENLQAAALANNQLSGYGYDAAGNMISDSTDGFTATYDAGNMLKTVGSITYWYDNDGQRYIKWNNGVPVKSYFYGSDGEILAEGSGGSTLTAEYIFFNGKRIARVDLPGNAVHYYLSDALNTTSMEVNSSGVVENESDYYPWGGELKFTANDPANPYKFTGKERDTETGLDYFGARYYSNGLGRFSTGDWSLTPVPVPYADFTDPQSLNQYSYVRNIPTVNIDADGHDGCCTLPSLEEVDQALEEIEAASGEAGTGVSLSAILTGGALVFGPVMIKPDILPGGTVGQSDADAQAAIQQADQERASQNAGVDPQVSTSGAGARKGGGRPYDDTPENLARMAQGKPPIGKDGKPVELHSPDQTHKDQSQELTRTNHRGKGNFKKNHTNTGQQRSLVNRNQAAKDRRAHWKKVHQKKTKRK